MKSPTSSSPIAMSMLFQPAINEFIVNEFIGGRSDKNPFASFNSFQPKGHVFLLSLAIIDDSLFVYNLAKKHIVVDPLQEISSLLFSHDTSNPCSSKVPTWNKRWKTKGRALEKESIVPKSPRGTNDGRPRAEP